MLASLLLVLCGVAQADPDSPALQRGEQVALVVHGILGYARWPQAWESLRLCAIGPTQYADVLLASQAADDQRPVSTRRLLIDEPTLESRCDAVYLGILDPIERQRLLARLTGKPILSISESSDACSDGSLFCMRSGIRVHPQVLQLGRRGGAQP